MKTCNFFFNSVRKIDRQAKATKFPVSFYTAEERQKFEVELRRSCKSRIKAIYIPRST